MKIAIIASHPIQYYAPWFRYIARQKDISVRVFYLLDLGSAPRYEPGFNRTLRWDIDLLEGYDHELAPNLSPLPGTNHIFGIYNPSLAQRISKYAPDAVFMTCYNYISIYNFIARWSPKKAPVIFRGDSHVIVPHKGIGSAVRRAWIKKTLNRFAACLYVGRSNYEYYRYHGVPAERLFFSPHAVDNERFACQAQSAKESAREWRAELKIPENDSLILFVGKFIEKKRPLDLIKAFRRSGLANTSLLFVGGGPQESALRHSASGAPGVFFAPFQNQKQMPRVYASADLLILPSCGTQEAWGLVVNEAMCMGLPIIASSHVGCALDLVHENENGLVFLAGSVSELASSIKEAFSDKNRLKTWGLESKNIIRDYSYAEATRGLRKSIDYVLS